MALNFISKNQKDSIPSLPDYGILIDSHHHGPKFSIARHQHPYHSLLYIVSGEGNCFIGGKNHELFANTAMVLEKGQQHRLVDKPGRAMVVFVVYFNESVAEAKREIFLPLLELGRPVLIAPHQAQEVRKNLRQMLHEQDNRAVKYEVAIAQCLASIALDIYRAHLRKDEVAFRTADRSPERVKKVLEYVTERYYEPHALSATAKMAYLSQRQFTNLCRKLTGKSFIEYVNNIRAQKAKELLIDTDMPVSAVAFEVGFEDVSTFYRAFKKYFRRPPLSFRS
jgi:AraC-like DNA-binding protein/mannose-6-phosphate isomerase-like protein (cupin superfamily)